MTSLERVEAFGHQLEAAEVTYYLNRSGAKKQDKFYASSVMDCGRAQVYNIRHADQAAANAASSLNIGWQRDAALGDIIHGLLQSWAVASGKIKTIPAFSTDHKPVTLTAKPMPAVEVPVDMFTIRPERYAQWKAARIGGKADGILSSEAGIDYIWEIKTVNTKYLTNPSYTKYMPDKLAHFEAQTQWYMWAFEITQALILVIDRERFIERFTNSLVWPWGSIYQEYRVDYDERFIESELERLLGLGRHLEKGTLPEGEQSRGPCRFCFVPCEFGVNGNQLLDQYYAQVEKTL